MENDSGHVLKIGFIGLGHMGLPMVANLIKAGHTVIAYDIQQEAVNKASQAGAMTVDNLKRLAEDVQIVFTMLQTSDQVSEVCLGTEGIFLHLPADSLFIDCSSIDVFTSRRLHAIADDYKVNMVDAPVSGGVAGAKAASLTFMVGGSEENFQRAKVILTCLGQRIIHAGGAGNGQVAKICNNMILGISMIAVSEAFTLAQKLGVKPKTFFEIVNNASGQCWSVSKYCPVPEILENVPANKGYAPGFAAGMMLKDLRLSQDAALQVAVSTPLGAEATALYSLFVNQGNFNMDFSGIIKMIAGH